MSWHMFLQIGKTIQRITLAWETPRSMHDEADNTLWNTIPLPLARLAVFLLLSVTAVGAAQAQCALADITMKKNVPATPYVDEADPIGGDPLMSGCLRPVKTLIHL